MGEYGRQCLDQFAGYIAAAERLKNIATQASAGEFQHALENEELQLLQEAHEFVRYINLRLIGHASKGNPNLSEIIDPYFVKGLPTYSGPIRYDQDAESISDLCEAFGDHPAWNLIWTYPEKISSISSSGAQIIRLEIEKITHEIQEAECEEVPVAMLAPLRSILANAANLIGFRTTLAFLVLKWVLINLDQLIYQAFQHDKLPVLDKTNVFDVSWGSNLIGHHTKVKAVPSKKAFHLQPGDLVLVKLAKESNLDSLHFVSRTTFSYSQDVGPEFDYRMRRVDQNLNCFEGLMPFDVPTTI